MTQPTSLPPPTDTHPTSPDVPAAAARLRELVAVCEAGGGDGWLETPWPRAREIAADLRVVLGALGEARSADRHGQCKACGDIVPLVLGVHGRTDHLDPGCTYSRSKHWMVPDRHHGDAS